MPDHLKSPRKRQTKLWLALGAVIVLLALIFVPPYISLNNYKARVTQSVAAALGRPVRLSSIELRLLPRPGFLLTDLTVQEEPQYGVEPVLHANEVMAAIRFSSLWQGKLQISRISVDEASLNLVRMPNGEWNLDSLFRNAAEGSKKDQGRQQPPYLEATNSRINIKNGIEKLPFSFVDADASMWRESNGNWRVRLKAQPARTDVALDLADTGIVRMDATLLPAPQFSQMPLHVDVDWREAQLGQLSRLVLSSDQGWRGDLTGELHLDGTADSAKVQTRLRAAGVHRAEFAPAAPIDFDATCGFTLRYAHRSVENLVCDSPVGDGRAHITGALPGDGRQPKVTVELDRIPAQAALDLLRTMRNSIDPSLQAVGSLSGHMTYDPAAAQATAQAETTAQLKRVVGRGHAVQPHAAPGPLTGSFTVAGLRVSGEALSRPIQVANMTLEPAPEQAGQPPALFTSMTIPAGGPTPLAVTARIALGAFELGVHGTAALPRLREFAHVTGSDAEPVLAQLAGDAAMLDFSAQGPWVPPPDTRLALSPANGPAPPPRSIQTNGTVALKNANWKASFLANPVMISAATLHMENEELRWDSVEFSYGPVKGSATFALPASCADPETCPPQFTLHFGATGRRGDGGGAAGRTRAGHGVVDAHQSHQAEFVGRMAAARGHGDGGFAGAGTFHPEQRDGRPEGAAGRRGCAVVPGRRAGRDTVRKADPCDRGQARLQGRGVVYECEPGAVGPACGDEVGRRDRERQRQAGARGVYRRGPWQIGQGRDAFRVATRERGGRGRAAGPDALRPLERRCGGGRRWNHSAADRGAARQPQDSRGCNGDIRHAGEIDVWDACENGREAKEVAAPFTPPRTAWG